MARLKKVVPNNGGGGGGAAKGGAGEGAAAKEKKNEPKQSHVKIINKFLKNGLFCVFTIKLGYFGSFGWF